MFCSFTLPVLLPIIMSHAKFFYFSTHLLWFLPFFYLIKNLIDPAPPFLSSPSTSLPSPPANFYEFSLPPHLFLPSLPPLVWSEFVIQPAFFSNSEGAGASEGGGTRSVRWSYSHCGTDPQQQALCCQCWYEHMFTQNAVIFNKCLTEILLEIRFCLTR